MQLQLTELANYFKHNTKDTHKPFYILMWKKQFQFLFKATYVQERRKRN